MSEKTSKNWLNALLLSVVLTVIYGIVAPMIITGMYAEIAILIGGICVFIGSFIFYFVFIFFKSIQKLRWLFGGIALFITFTIIVNSDLDLYVANTFNSTQLPKEYENYVSVNTDEPIYFGKHKMQLSFSSYEPIKHFVSSQGNLIVITSIIPKDRDFKEVEEDRYGGGTQMYQDFTTYKLNKDGAIIDQYTFKRTRENFTEILFDDYIVNTDREYFRTWVTDGDTLKKPIILLNKDYKWTKEQQIAAFGEAYNAADYYKIEGHNYASQGMKSSQEIIYFTKGKWYKLFIDTYLPNRNERNDHLGETTYLANVFGKYAPENYGDVPDWGYFTPTYFHRIKLDNITHSIGGNSPSSEEPSWQGDLLCQLAVDSDTLKFKKSFWFGKNGSSSKYYNANGTEIAKLKFELEQDYYPYFYYTSEKFNFKLFTTNATQLYLITPIK